MDKKVTGKTTNGKKVVLVNLSFEKIYEKTSMVGAAP